jgi:hypothetical protein
LGVVFDNGVSEIPDVDEGGVTDLTLTMMGVVSEVSVQCDDLDCMRKYYEPQHSATIQFIEKRKTFKDVFSTLSPAGIDKVQNLNMLQQHAIVTEEYVGIDFADSSDEQLAV